MKTAQLVGQVLAGQVWEVYRPNPRVRLGTAIHACKPRAGEAEVCSPPGLSGFQLRTTGDTQVLGDEKQCGRLQARTSGIIF